MTSTVLQHPETDAPPRPPETKSRDPWFDNAKILLVALVVVGHSWADIRESALATSAYDFL